jgi:hypothetical protein
LRDSASSLLALSELASRVKERFGVPVRSKLFRFLHLLREGASMPRTITSTANPIKSDRDPRLAGAVGVVGTAAGVLSVSEDVLAVAAGVVAASGVLTVSEGMPAVTAGVVAAVAGVAGGLRERAGSSVG